MDSLRKKIEVSNYYSCLAFAIDSKNYKMMFDGKKCLSCNSVSQTRPK